LAAPISDRNRHAATAQALEGERLTQCRRQGLGDDPGAGQVPARVEAGHVPAASATKPGLTAEDLCGHRARRNDLRDGQEVRPVGGADRILRPQMRTDRRSDRLLAGRGSADQRALEETGDRQRWDLDSAEPFTLLRVVATLADVSHSVESPSCSSQFDNDTPLRLRMNTTV
jgi:hypothetical protein